MKWHLDRYYVMHLLLQCLSATAFMWLILMGLDQVVSSQLIWAAGASTLASSAFIVFVLPDAIVAKPFKIIGSYLIAMGCGAAIRGLAMAVCAIFPQCTAGIPHSHLFEIAAAVAVGLSLLVMVLCRSEHPPAAGLAVVMVLDIRTPIALVIILAGAIILAMIRFIFRRKLLNLV